MPWTDSHCHLQPLTEREEAEARARNRATDGAANLVARARAAGVGQMICVGTDAASSRRAIELASREPDVHPTVGLHPHDASRLEAEWAELVELAATPGVVAVGETGFDLHYRHSDDSAQAEAFRRQIELAHTLDLALVVHTRDAWDETLAVLAEVGVPGRCVIHCFTGGPAEAARAVDAGAYISFSGIVTFPKAPEVREAVTAVPLDRLLVETDAPFLAPVPHRGSPNEPAFVPVVGATLAEVLGLGVDDIMRVTSENASRVFRVPTPPSTIGSR